MPSRIEIELTSQRDSETWTWRAAGAREPKGTLDGSILPTGAEVGSVFRAEADFTIDGIDILSVTTPTRDRKDPFETLELLGSGSDEPLVTTSYSEKDGRGRNDRGRSKGKGKGRGKGSRGEKGRGRGDDDRRGRPRGRKGPDVPPPPSRPKPPRLRAGRTHRKAFLESLPPEQKPVAEQALKGGIPAVRKAVEQQNEQLAAEGKPAIKPDALVSMAESLLPRVRAAEWRDRAEAAVEQLDDVDLRDLRSVVTAADRAARDDETRALAATLREGLERRLAQEHQHWIEDLTDAVEHARAVRGLRLSSRPPKAGTPVPPELATGLVEMINQSLKAEVSTERWIRILDELATSPIRSLVVPASLPTPPSTELAQAIARHGKRLPELAHIFGIEPETAAQAKRRRTEERKKAKQAKRDHKARQASKAPKGEKAAQGTRGEQADKELQARAERPPPGSEPKKPEQVEQAEQPESSAQPESSEQAEQPESSAQPESSGQVEQAGQPESSAQPESSEQAEQPESSAQPESSGQAEQPASGDPVAGGARVDQ